MLTQQGWELGETAGGYESVVTIAVSYGNKLQPPKKLQYTVLLLGIQVRFRLQVLDKCALSRYGCFNLSRSVKY